MSELVRAAREHLRSGDLALAEQKFLEALTSEPDNCDALEGLGLVEIQKGNLFVGEALTLKANASALAPRATSLCNLASIYIRLGKFDEGLKVLDQAEGLDIPAWVVHVNRGGLYIAMGDPIPAIKEFEKAFETITDNRINTLIADLGYAYLMSGDFERGFALTMNMWGRRNQETADLQLPDLDPTSNTDLSNKRVLLYSNQGSGDAIQFNRYMRKFANACGSCTLGVGGSLVRLFDHQNRHTHLFNRVINSTDVSQEDYDFVFPVSLLPLWNKTRINSIPLPESLYVIPSRITLPSPRLKVGLVWAARVDHGTGPQRTVPLYELLPIATVPGTEFYSLQVGLRVQDIYDLNAQILIQDMSSHIHDFQDLACLMCEMDVIVSADTGPLHLAASLGIDTIGMLSRGGADWRWLSAQERTRSPWYPSLQLISQSQREMDWSNVVKEVKRALQYRIDAFTGADLRMSAQ